MLYIDNLDDFEKYVTTSAASFSLCSPADRPPIYYFQTQVGKARIVYASPCTETSPSVPGPNAQLVAVVTDRNLYLTSPVVSFDPKKELPARFSPLYTKLAQLNTAGAKILMQLYEKMEPAKKSGIPQSDKLKVKKLARIQALTSSRAIEVIEQNLFSESDAIADLAGKFDINQAVQNYFNANRDLFARKKGIDELISGKLADPGFILPWEKRLADALRKLEVSRVAIEFTRNGQTASCMIPAYKVLDRLIQKRGFSPDLDDWTVLDVMKKLLTKTEISQKASLSCNDISAVMFQKKLYYKKEN